MGSFFIRADWDTVLQSLVEAGLEDAGLWRLGDVELEAYKVDSSSFRADWNTDWNFGIRWILFPW